MSSVSDGYEQFRATARRLVEALGHEPVLIGETSPALPRPPQRACLSAVAACDVMVLMLGAKYGTVQQSGKSATSEEWERARDLGKDILVFKERSKPESTRQADFIREVRDYEGGLSYKAFSTQAELQEELVRALRRVEEERREATDFALRLPEPVSSMLESMRVLFPDSLIRIQRLLAAAAADGPDILVQLTENPPIWATQPGPQAWEAIAGFIDASCMAGGSQVRTLAIEAGSQRRSLYLALNAISAAERAEDGQGNGAAHAETAAAEATAAEIPAEDPLHAATRARMRRVPEEVLEAVREAALQDSEDPAVCELAAGMLAWAFLEKDRPEEALAALDVAATRHPGRPWLLLQQAQLTLGLGLAPDLGTIRKPGLLRRAHQLAVDARDRLRALGGPSHRAVLVACQALAALEEPKSALRVGLTAPEGGATRAEAAHASVQRVVAEAMLMLGRHDDMDQLDLDSFDPWLRGMTRALQAHARDAPTAVRLMHKAFKDAREPEARKYVAFALATLGERVDEIDEKSLGLTVAETALFSGVAALQGGDPDSAVEILRSHLPESQMHADWLWRAQQKQGDTHAAIETLRAAVEHFGPDPLGADLVEQLVESGNTTEAEAAANDALSRSASRDVRRRLQTALLHLAEASQDWQKAHEHAAAMHSENPEHSGAAWSAVYALSRQGRDEDARRYLCTHRLTPTSEDAAHLVTVLLGGPNAPEVDTAGLLELAKLFPRSEQVAGSVLLAMMSGGERVSLTEEQRDTARELLEEFVERFPTSEILWRVQAASVQEQAEMLREMVRQRSSAIDWQLVDDVHAGRAPYGLLWSPGRPYTSLLLDSDCPGGYLTAVSADPETLEREIEAARVAMGGAVVIDTSVVVLAARTALSLDRLAGVFGRVLVPDQLLADASLAVAQAKTRGDATMWYESAVDQVAFREFSQLEKDRMVESAERVVAALKKRQRAASGGVRPEWYPDSVIEPFVWDAALRVAAVRGCALWCDDAALRHLAETLGIATFGTYALYEVLDGQPESDTLPGSLDTRIDLLRAHIADVPINWTELAEGCDDSDGPDPAWDLWFSRPAAWRDPAVAAGFAHRVRVLQDRWVQHMPNLVHAACRGLGAAAVDGDRKRALGWVLAGVLLELNDPAPLAAGLVHAARAAAAGRDERSQIDPLPAGAEILLAAYEAETDAAVAAQKLLSVFSSLSPADLRIAASVIGSLPDSPAAAESAKPAAVRGQRRPRTTARSRPSSTSRPHSRRPRPPGSAAASELGKALRTRRLSLELTQQALAERCGVPRARISAVESGVSRHRIGTLLSLAREMRSSLSLAPLSVRLPSPRTGITSLNSLGRAIRAVREELGWRQQDLAAHAKVSRVQISKIEAARSDALTDTVLKLTDAAGLVVRIDHDDDDAFELDDIIAAHSGPASVRSGRAS